MIIGHVGELWRYPVKSMAGERLATTEVVPTFGIPGDRAWALRDEEAGEIRGARRMVPMLACHPRYLEAPVGDSAPPIQITLPSGRVTTSADPLINELLSAELGKQVSLWPRQPATNVEFFRRAHVGDEAELRDNLGLLPDEPLPDLTVAPEAMRRHLTEFVAPLGTYFDAYPLSLITTASMNAIGAASPESTIDSRRFRQNVVVETTDDITGYVEAGWAGRHLKIGSLHAVVTIPIPRCVMVTLPQDGLPQDRPLMRALVRHTGQMLGVYLQLPQRGIISEGDPIELLEGCAG